MRLSGCLALAAAMLALYSCGDAPNTDLGDAAYNGDLPKLEAALQKRANPNERDSHGFTPLMWAAQSQNGEAVIPALIKAGADPNARGRGEGWTPLMYAIKTKSAASLKALLDGGADHNGRNQKGETPLLVAVHENNLDALRTLLSRGADASLAANDATDPLSEAVASCHAPLVAEIRQAGPALKLKSDKVGQEALATARSKCPDVVQLLGLR